MAATLPTASPADSGLDAATLIARRASLDGLFSASGAGDAFAKIFAATRENRAASLDVKPEAAPAEKPAAPRPRDKIADVPARDAREDATETANAGDSAPAPEAAARADRADADDTPAHAEKKAAEVREEGDAAVRQETAEKSETPPDKTAAEAPAGKPVAAEEAAPEAIAVKATPEAAPAGTGKDEILSQAKMRAHRPVQASGEDAALKKQGSAGLTAETGEDGKQNTPLSEAAKKTASDAAAKEKAERAGDGPALPTAKAQDDPASRETRRTDFTALLKGMPQEKKDVLAGKDAAPSGEISPPLPAAGARANAFLSVASPTPAGPGGSVSRPGAGAPGVPGAGASTGATTGLALAQTMASENAAAGLAKAAAPSRAAPSLPAAQVTIALTRMAKNGIDRFDMQLHPQELGRVNIRLEIKDGVARASVTADNPATLQILQKDGRALEKVLQQAGLETDANSLDFNLRGENGGGRHNLFANTPAGKGWSGDPAIAPDTESTKTTHYTVAPGRVNLTV